MYLKGKVFDIFINPNLPQKSGRKKKKIDFLKHQLFFIAFHLNTYLI